MNKSLITLIVCALSPIYVLAQEVFSKDIYWGNEQKKKLSELYPEFIGLNNDKVTVVRTKTMGASLIEEYNSSTLENISKEKLKLEYNGRSLTRVDQLIFGGQIHFITSYRNKETQKKHFFIHKYLGDGLLSDPKLIGTIDWQNVPGQFSLKSGSTKKMEAKKALKLVLSPNDKNILIMHPSIIEPKEGEANTWHALSLDENLEENWKYDFTLPSNNLYLDKVKFSNEGKVFCAGIENVKLKKKARLMTYSFLAEDCLIGEAYQLVIVDGKNKNMKVIDLAMGEGNIISYSMDLLGDEVIFYGLTGSKENVAEGVMVKKISSTGEQLFLTEEKFASNFFALDEDLNPKSKGISIKSKMQRNFILRDLTLSDNGDLILLAEQFQFYTTTMTSPYSRGAGSGSMATGPSISLHYIYSDIIAINCSSEGEIKWMNRIHKYQHSENDYGYFSSYYAMVKGNDLYILMNDFEYYVRFKELQDKTLKEKRKAKKKNVVSVTKISSNGEVDRKILIEVEDHVIAPRSAALINGSLIMSGLHYDNKGLLITPKDIKQLLGKMPIK
ncbi:MAG: hypothetical protein JKY09_04050 [Crocinitomicaceae bacterium]|nr:hypothetical protein [Crocinitomicaceae bacterium]